MEEKQELSFWTDLKRKVDEAEKDIEYGKIYNAKKVLKELASKYKARN